jgi:hypothetical protein
MNALIMMVLVTCILRDQSEIGTGRNSTWLRLLSVVVVVLGVLTFTLSYILYTPSLGIIGALLSSLTKQGPLLLFCIPGIFCALRDRKAANSFIAVLALISFSSSLFSWKAADSAPIFLAPLSGIGLTSICHTARKIVWAKPFRNPRSVSIIVILIGLTTTVFGLIYYPARYYITHEPQVFDEIGEIHRFVSGNNPQRGMVLYGTGYTELAVGPAYAGMIVIGPEQKPFYYLYNLHHLTSTNFDSQIITHPELTYVSTLQLHQALYSHNGENLNQLLKNFFIQYIVLQRSPRSETWTQINRAYLKERLATKSYKVYEVTSTQSQVQLLSFIEQHLPVDARILAPYSISYAIGQVRNDYLTSALKTAFDLNYPHMYERLVGGPNRSNELSALQERVKTLNNLYSDPERLVTFAKEKNFGYAVCNRDISKELLQLDQKLIFQNEELFLFEIAKGLEAHQANARRITVSDSTLAINIFDTLSYDPDRYALTTPVQECVVKLEQGGLIVREGRTDASGTIILSVPPGNYSVTASTEELTTTVKIQVNEYAFAPILLHHSKEDPGRLLLPFIVTLNSILALAATISPRKQNKRTLQ